jgi:hypothetical protein
MGKIDLTEAKRIATRMLAMPPQPHNAPKKPKAKSKRALQRKEKPRRSGENKSA